MKTILLVEDEFGIAGVLTVLLEDAGYRVLSAGNGREGLEQLAANRPNVVVTDYMMPLMDGAAMARAIRADPAFQDIPIIMMTSVREDIVRQHFAGYTAYMRKPFQTEVLLDLIARIAES
ncbi:response regulator [Azospirillum brasilense]|uniref:Response regulator n=1 Tax=Azospirillum brasilense TaxID=192 RepID=A0A235H915_AZOBR|nr:response regulator [Azospirillum brasilense]OYD81963.1 response regulator [Azospirillum brasilense]